MAPEAPAFGDAARDGGDLVVPPRARDAPDRRAVAGARGRGGRRCAGARAGGGDDLPPFRGAGEARRRREADLRRGREARPCPGGGERQRRPGARAPAEGDRARRAAARPRAVGRQGAGGRRRGGAREARALPPRARRDLRVTRHTFGAVSLTMAATENVAWLESLSPWPA